MLVVHAPDERLLSAIPYDEPAALTQAELSNVTGLDQRQVSNGLRLLKEELIRRQKADVNDGDPVQVAA